MIRIRHRPTAFTVLWMAAAAILAVPGTALPQSVCPDPGTLAENAEGVMTHVRYLADDALEGRDTGSEGERCAAAYLVQALASYGLEPAGEAGSWFQTFAVRTGTEVLAGELTIGSEPRWSAAYPPEGPTWTPYAFSASGRADGELVYAGAGVAHPGSGERLPEVAGKIAVVEGPGPGEGGLYGDPHFKASVAAGRGAEGVLVLLHPGASLPEVGSDVRPDVGVPVAAVAHPAAETVREAARAGEIATFSAQVQPVMSEARNVIARLRGTAPELRDEHVVLGAHYDHLGRGGEGSLAPDLRAIHNGADDNASGTAALLEAARLLASGPPPDRSVLFVAFSGEEMGLLGSAHFVEEPTVGPLEDLVAMINMDMVGRLRNDALTVYGVGTAEEWDRVVERANAALSEPLALATIPDGFGPSDHASFYGEGIPVLHLFTNTHTEYHRPSDDWQTINARGIERVAELAAGLARELAGGPERVAAALTPVEQTRNPHGDAAPSSSSGGGYGPYLGTIPDMSPTDHGVRLTGVREGSPAEEAGLRGGDLIVEFAGREITDLYAYTYALRDQQAGDEVEIVVERDGERVTLTAVLGERQ